MEIDLKEILDDNEKFINSMGKGKDIQPQLIVCKNKKLSIVLIAGKREEIRLAMDLIEKIKPEWVAFMSSGFAGMKEHMKNYRHGDLQKKMNKGNKDVLEVVFIQAYSKEGKIMRTLDQKTHKRIYDDNTEFAGYLSINDIERVFW